MIGDFTNLLHRGLLLGLDFLVEGLSDSTEFILQGRFAEDTDVGVIELL